MNKKQYVSLAEPVYLFVFLLENKVELYIYRKNKRENICYWTVRIYVWVEQFLK